MDLIAERGKELFEEAETTLRLQGSEALESWEAALSPEDKAALVAHWHRFAEAMNKFARDLKILTRK